MKRSAKHLYLIFSLAVVPVGINATAGAETPAAPAAKVVPKAIPLAGKVLETMDGGGYTYVLLKNGNDKVWVAVPQMKVTVGKDVKFAPGYEFKNFSSKGLNRKFDRVIFSAGPADQEIKLAPAAMKMAHQGMPAEQAKAKAAAPAATSASAAKGATAKTAAASNAVSGTRMAVTAPKAATTAGSAAKVGRIAKAKGANAYSIAELYAKKAKLEKKPVVVRGKVVNVSSHIMKRNWIHIQDGTGSAGKKNNMLVVTSTQEPNIGDVVTVSGVAYNNMDFGYGYKYSLMVQEAKISK